MWMSKWSFETNVYDTKEQTPWNDFAFSEWVPIGLQRLCWKIWSCWFTIGLRCVVWTSIGCQIPPERRGADVWWADLGGGTAALWGGFEGCHSIRRSKVWFWCNRCDRQSEDVGNTLVKSFNFRIFSIFIKDTTTRRTASTFSAEACFEGHQITRQNGSWANVQSQVPSTLERSGREGVVPEILTLLVETGLETIWEHVIESWDGVGWQKCIFSSVFQATSQNRPNAGLRTCTAQNCH